MAIVIAKNNTAGTINIQDLGISLATAEIINLTNFYKFFELVMSNDLKALVSAGTVTINDGVSDLNIADGLDHLKVESEYYDLIQDESIGSGIVATDLKYCGITTSAEWTIPQTTYTDVSYSAIEYQNDTSVIEWTSGVNDRIYVKKSGTYLIVLSLFVRCNTQGGTTATNMASTFYRVRKNDNTVILPEQYCHTYYLEVQQSHDECVVYLNAGDFITAQVYAETGKSITLTRARLSVMRAEGIEGPAGPAGGTTVEVRQAGTTVTTNTNIINFQGNAVAVASGGAGNAIVTINQSAHIFKYIQLIDGAGNQQMNVASPGMVLTWNTQQLRDTDTFDHSTSTNPSRITVLVSGWYEISYSASYTLATQRTGIKTNIRKNGNTILLPTSSYGYGYVTGISSNSCGGVLVQLNANEYIELLSVRRLVSGNMNTVAGESSLTMTLIRIL
jgi:hypothetical protein